ncbi:MAG: hypothetical protein LQ343_003441 [Gyalolechia ehrenbergii]|nr:MAG: hypothetical protein LQ343_003441 [Gyalolechia ehrenbergii]
MPISLEDLPPELLAQIVSDADSARTLTAIALSCTKLYNFIESDGYRAFVQNHYPSIQTPPFWKDAAHALTTLSRAWDRKSLVARCLRPPPNPAKARHPNHTRRARGQTMGYQPVIDSYESWTASDWTSRREILAWGAGAELVIRIKLMGPNTEKEWESKRRSKDSKENMKGFDQHHHWLQWWRVASPYHRDGHDDITAVKLLRDRQKPLGHYEYVIIGRANGELNMISIDRGVRDMWKMETRFLTDGRNVRSASINSAEQPLLAACLDDRTIAIYPIPAGHAPVPPLGKIQITQSENSCRIWSTVFLRQDRLAIGLGPSVDPIQVHEIKPDAISSQPIRRFAIHENCFKGYPTRGTVYPLVPLPRSSSSSALEGDLFLSGGHDGIIRLHDLRSPASFEAGFTDLVDHFSAIYSLLPIGRGRFLAGGSNHSLLKVFHMGKVIEDLCCCSSVDHTSADHECSAITDPNDNELKSDQRDPRNWNIFLTDKGPHASKLSDTQRISASPVYSLSSPSPCSPTIFAGVEGQVIQLDITSVYDRFPDPVFKFGPKRTEQKHKDAVREWDSHNEVMCLAMYEQVRGPVALKQQSIIGELGVGIPGWDERWRHL